MSSEIKFQSSKESAVTTLLQGVASDNVKFPSGAAGIVGSPNSAEMADDNTALMVKELPDPVETEDAGFCLDCITLLCCPCCIPCTCASSWTQVNEREEAVVLQFGKYSHTVKNPGIRWINCCGNNVKRVSTAIRSADVPPQKIIDSQGNPLSVGAIIVYYVTNSYRAAIAVANFDLFVIQAAQAVLKTVVQQHPYEDPNGGESLRNEATKIGGQLVTALQVKADKAGIKILSFEFNELSYAPEIAPQMLKRQQAQAVVAARHLIVQGAVETAEHAMQAFEAKGYSFSQPAREKMVSDLMAVMVSDRDPHTNINVAQRSVAQDNASKLAALRQAFPNIHF